MVRVFQIYNLIRRMDKRVVRSDERDERKDLWWFGHVERMENDKIAKRVHVGDCAGSRSDGRPRNRWNETAKACLKKKKKLKIGLEIRQPRRMVYVRSE